MLANQVHHLSFVNIWSINCWMTRFLVPGASAAKVVLPVSINYFNDRALMKLMAQFPISLV